MSSPVLLPMPFPISDDVPTVLDDASPKCIDPATSSEIRSIMYNQNNGYDLEWESRSDFNKWLTHEQAAIGIEI